jgi:LysR family transcriptional regulator, glycine cleavage system transcriptional activator
MSFREAAIELRVTPTAISHQIRLLEDICGQPLFRRRPRPLALTDAGERLFPVIRNGFDAFAVAIASALTGSGQRLLRVTSPNAFASRWLVPRLPKWREGHPNIQLAQEIFRDTFFPICSPDLLAKGPRQIERAADLLHYPLIHFDWMNRDPDAPNWRRWLATARSVDPSIPETNKAWDLSFREELHAIDAVAAGQGIAICSDVVVSRELKSRTLVKAHDLSLPGYGFYLVQLPNHPQRPTIEAFAAWMRSEA